MVKKEVLSVFNALSMKDERRVLQSEGAKAGKARKWK